MVHLLHHLDKIYGVEEATDAISMLIAHDVARNSFKDGSKAELQKWCNTKNYDFNDTKWTLLRQKKLVRIRDGIILAELGDEVAESWEEALELPTDEEQLVDRKRLGGDSRPR